MLNIFVTVCGRPDLLRLQYEAFTKNVKEPFRFVVLNNTVFDHAGYYTRIVGECEHLGIERIDIPKDEELAAHYEWFDKPGNVTFGSDGGYLNANVAAAYPLTWAWQNIIWKLKEPVLIAHSDVFPVTAMKPTEWLKENQIVFVPSSKAQAGTGRAIEYIWDAFGLFDMAALPQPAAINWWCGQIDGTAVDVGGQTYHYLQAHPEVKTLKVQSTHYPDFETPSSNIDMFFIPKSTAQFLHYRSGSNWNKKSSEYHQAKTEWLRKQI